MMNPEEVRSLLRQGRTLENWRVIHGSARLAVRDVWKRCALLLLGMEVINLAGFGLGSYLHPAGQSNFLIFWMWLVIWPVLAITLSCIRASDARRSVAVFLPEGFMQFGEMDKPVLPQGYTSWRAFWYASMADVQLKSSFLNGQYLEIRNHEGQTYKWFPDPCFGPRGLTIQDMLTGYTTYNMLHRLQERQTSYMHYPLPPIQQE